MGTHGVLTLALHMVLVSATLLRTHGRGLARICAGLLIIAAAPSPAQMLSLPAGGRIGVLDMTLLDVVHFHTGRSTTGSFMKTYRLSWPPQTQFGVLLEQGISTRGFSPVMLDPPDPIRRNRERWFISNTRSQRFARDCTRELSELAEQQKLDAVVIAVPGFNDSPEPVEGNRLRELPDYLQGWGFTTRDGPREEMEPVLFNLTQLLLFDTTGDEARFVHREWGGSYLYQWGEFNAPADLHEIPDAELEKLRPLFADIASRQVGRLFEHVEVAR